ncbi:hypothetical protein SELR_20340 [Selenomonas ruminantium subsp. lactilytica TAM6421]|uniref:Prepilin-type N-terminal cleavage/methylation domain-containing protein n=1 Tax=Selenomonas ruminantium subsp. lactilytica (strain NBRC 103574 / TAM6421) TaxID=927704 RepID=I0GSK5_SELRL|nr:hypothetical protein [Selenomonas ruminantium]BAL83742.1 hypothetical protein SELR_20340 [Selenomonas ruminantium subsp. lactilytica TAM6421]
MLSIRRREAGFMLWEMMLVAMVILLFSAQAIPRGFKIYRQMVVEYEAEELLADIRHCQALNRLVRDRGWKYGAQKPEEKFARLDLLQDGSRLTGGNRYIMHYHVYYPGVQIEKINKQGDFPHEHNNTQISFEVNGWTHLETDMGLMTLLVYFKGYPREGRRIIISKGGRIRMERGGS